jgi:uncharacterized protein
MIMSIKPAWSFYGRRQELHQLQQILLRRRWFFLQISGRRRIGKTALIQQALQSAGIGKTLYIQIPDSDPAGVIAACKGYLETFGVAAPLSSLAGLAELIGRLVEEGYVIALDEFQYFHRKQLSDFCSLLQAQVDRLASRAGEIRGGLIVLGSMHAEMTALLEDRDAPLFNRTTDTITLGHLDISSILEMLRVHADTDPHRLLFLWNLFEGVPKFYRDAYEQDVLNASRTALLERLFFASSSPLRNEADNWFLRELRGRYDMVLQFLARHPGCSNADIESAVADVSAPGDSRQVGGYLKVLTERYAMVERRLPIFSPGKARSGRYYLKDNFLRAWLSALQRPVSAIAFKPLDTLVSQADGLLAMVEGHALKDLTGKLYEERSRLGLGEFRLSERVRGYWDRADIDIDFVAVNEDERRIRFGTCKRNAQRLIDSIAPLHKSVDRFLNSHRRFAGWAIEYVAIAPAIDQQHRSLLLSHGLRVESLHDLIDGL